MKILNKSENIRRMLLWIIVIIVGLVSAVFWLSSSYQKIKEFQMEKFIKELKLPINNE